MHKDVTDYVTNCDTCQKKDKRQNPVEIQQRPISVHPFDTISVDHAGPFDTKEQKEKRREQDPYAPQRRSTRPRYCLVKVDKAT